MGTSQDADVEIGSAKYEVQSTKCQVRRNSPRRGGCSDPNFSLCTFHFVFFTLYFPCVFSRAVRTEVAKIFVSARASSMSWGSCWMQPSLKYSSQSKHA